MWKTIWGAAKALAGQKKFQAAVLSGIVWAVGKIGFHADESTLLPIVGPLWVYIFGQGLADFGKSAAQVTAGPAAAASAAPPTAAK